MILSICISVQHKDTSYHPQLRTPRDVIDGGCSSQWPSDPRRHFMIKKIEHNYFRLFQTRFILETSSETVVLFERSVHGMGSDRLITTPNSPDRSQALNCPRPQWHRRCHRSWMQQSDRACVAHWRSSKTSWKLLHWLLHHKK